jgi:hypothetical protein
MSQEQHSLSQDQCSVFKVQTRPCFWGSVSIIAQPKEVCQPHLWLYPYFQILTVLAGVVMDHLIQSELVRLGCNINLRPKTLLSPFSAGDKMYLTMGQYPLSTGISVNFFVFKGIRSQYGIL